MIDNIPKLTWACRRGMLELDVLLGNFLKTGYPNLTVEEKSLFINLLEYSDPELFDWLMGSASPEEDGLAKITDLIRHHAHAKF